MKCKFVEELTKIYQSNLDTDVIKLACLEIMGNKKSGLREGQDGLWFLGWQSDCDWRFAVWHRRDAYFFRSKPTRTPS